MKQYTPSLFSLIIGLFLLVFSLPVKSFAWGQVGHRIIGEIAWLHMSKKARKNVQKALGNESLAMVSNWMDFVKSDHDYDHMYNWHFVTIPDGMTYEESEKSEKGDVIAAIRRVSEELRTGQFSSGNEREAICILAHLVGDIHQPLHVGKPGDKGGNDVKVDYFWEESNLHRVWDSGIIDKQQLSYTEWVAHINHPSPEQVDQWQANSVWDWARESMDLRPQVYDVPENDRLSWRYNFDNIDTIEQRLLQAGIRLAGLLNEIYG